MQRHKFFCRIAGATLIAAVAFSGLGASALTLEEAKAKGVKLALYHEPPLVFLDQNGKPAGAYSQLVIGVLKRMGIVNVDPVMTEWSSLIPNLSAGRSDMVLPMYILPARCEQVAFSEPVWRGEESFLVLKGNPLGLNSYEEAAKKGARLALLSGSAELDYAKRAGVPESKVFALQDPPSMMQAILAGRADALALPVSSVDELASKSNGRAERAANFQFNQLWLPYGGVVFRKQDSELRAAFNAELKAFIGSPEFMTLMAPMQYTKDNLPGARTADELCHR